MSERFNFSHRAFRFDLGYERWVSPTTQRLNHLVYAAQSENPEVRQPAFVAALQTIRREAPYNPTSERLVYCADILSSIAWRPGNNLSNVIQEAEILLQPTYPQDVRQLMAEAIKNAAWHDGPHVRSAVALAITDHGKMTPKIRYQLLKAVGAAARHSKEIVQTDEVRNYLNNALLDDNPIIARRAKRIISRI